MTDSDAVKPAQTSAKVPGTPFKKGFDERRWLAGRPRVPKDAKKIFDHLLWEVLSEEITNPSTGEKVDRLRAMLRSMTTSRQSADKQAILDRILGKVAQSVDVTTGGEKIETNNKAEDDKRFERAILTLAETLRDIVPVESTK